MKKFLTLVCVLALMVSSISFAVAEEPIELTYWRGELGRNACATYGETLWFQELQKRTGINVKIIGPAQGADSNTAVNAMLTSGHYPDMLYFNWDQNYPGGVEAGVEDGVIYDWSKDPESKEKVANWWKVINESETIRRAVTLDNGSIVIFCHWEPDIRRGAYWGHAIRTDWLERLNLEVPTTIEELEKVLYAFKEQDANGNGDPNDEIPMIDVAWGTSCPGVNSLAAIWGMKVNQIYADPQTGNMTFWTEYKDGEPFKAYVSTMAKWVKDGILDKEYVSTSGDQQTTKITSDKAGFFFEFPDNVATHEASLKKFIGDAGYADPEKVHIVGVTAIKGPDGIPYNYDNDNSLIGYAGVTQPTVITTAAVAKEGHLDACYKFLNFCYSDEGSEIINFGVEGISYTKDENGKHVWTELITADPDYPPSDAVFKYAYCTQGSFPKAMSYEGWALMNLTNEDQIATHLNYAAGVPALNRPPVTLNVEEKEAYSTVITDINTAVSETYVKVILGQEPVEKLDALLTQVDGMGIQQAIDAYQSAYERYMKK